ncbi:sulfite exporter TauE/SafE family protein [Natronospora cellulosivora (SeqCode)]
MSILGLELGMVLLILLLGFNTGVLSAFFGVGGAFIVTPSLNFLGFSMVQAGATALSFGTITASVAGFKHYLKKNVIFKVGIIIAITATIGVALSEPLYIHLNYLGLADNISRYLYIVMLLSLGIMPLLKKRVNTSKNDNISHSNDNPNFFQKYLIKSSKFDLEKKICSVGLFNMVIVGLLGGFVKVFMGVCGGFFLVPMSVMFLNMKIHKAVGTSLLVILLSNIYAVYLRLSGGNIQIAPIIFLALTAYFGIKIGSKSISNINGSELQVFYSSFLLAMVIGLIMMQLGYERRAMIYNFTLITFVTTIIIIKYYFEFNLIYNRFFKKRFILLVKNNKKIRTLYYKMK